MLEFVHCSGFNRSEWEFYIYVSKKLSNLILNIYFLIMHSLLEPKPHNLMSNIYNAVCGDNYECNLFLFA